MRVEKEEKKRETSYNLPLLCVLTATVVTTSHPFVFCFVLSPGLILERAIDFSPLSFLVYSKHPRTTVQNQILRTLPRSTAAH